jgi:hypothetical protein
VQDLQIGDEVQTLAGPKTIKWIGYNKFTKEEGSAWQDSIMPIRVMRFAIDDHTPHCDLYLSPYHCIFFNEALIPVMYLINEASIAQGTPSEMSALEYYHVELDTHEVIYAERALVESYIFDDNACECNRSGFVDGNSLSAFDSSMIAGLKHFYRTLTLNKFNRRPPRSRQADARLRGEAQGRSPDWLKMKNADAPAVNREAEEDWGKERWRR